MKCFAIPALAPDDIAGEVSRFLEGHRVLTVDRQFVADGAASYWAVCVTYLESGAREPAQTQSQAG